MSQNNNICIIDYQGGGNLFSLENSFTYIGANTYRSSHPEEILKADKIIFPGVGSFGTAMKQINKLNIADAIVQKSQSGIPFLGICVGMQVLFASSSESSKEDKLDIVDGLNVFEMPIRKFDFLKIKQADLNEKIKIPHMGWNQVKLKEDSQNPLFKDIPNSSDFYFVHSYRAHGKDADISESMRKRFPKLEVAETNYIEDFVSHIWNGENLFACQFHPEKSSETGLQLLKNFIAL
ncbi:MAG: imidazole glycerol phosphate synthase subunit HisH [Candidatus Caenarcaniphilales bacterium]|nr:imidazole glycerol phosphate synthase subunit HisH [Candidatus Caenarcaniphilales bacterium]